MRPISTRKHGTCVALWAIVKVDLVAWHCAWAFRTRIVEFHGIKLFKYMRKFYCVCPLLNRAYSECSIFTSFSLSQNVCLSGLHCSRYCGTVNTYSTCLRSLESGISVCIFIAAVMWWCYNVVCCWRIGYGLCMLLAFSWLSVCSRGATTAEKGVPRSGSQHRGPCACAKGRTGCWVREGVAPPPLALWGSGGITPGKFLKT